MQNGRAFPELPVAVGVPASSSVSAPVGSGLRPGNASVLNMCPEEGVSWNHRIPAPDKPHGASLSPPPPFKHVAGCSLSVLYTLEGRCLRPSLLLCVAVRFIQSHAGLNNKTKIQALARE